jgi:hypothetical protein
MAVMVVLVTEKYLRLKDDNKVCDGGGDHGSDGGPRHCEVSLPREITTGGLRLKDDNQVGDGGGDHGSDGGPRHCEVSLPR